MNMVVVLSHLIGELNGVAWMVFVVADLLNDLFSLIVFSREIAWGR